MPKKYSGLIFSDYILWCCGLAEDNLRITCDKVFGVITRRLAQLVSWGQTYGFVDSLYYFCAQVLHPPKLISVSVNTQFYPLSTLTTKTTTNKRKDK